MRNTKEMKTARELVAEDFESLDTVGLARSLLAKHLVLRRQGQVSSRMIVEVEAYDGPEDLACHASNGRTKRTEPLFGPPGHWYVYLCYGIHEMLNLVTGPEGYPAAILIRGLEDVTGPGRLTKRLGIDRRFNAKRADCETGMWLEDRGVRIAPSKIQVTPRIGVDYAGEDWAMRPYRFALEGIYTPC